MGDGLWELLITLMIAFVIAVVGFVFWSYFPWLALFVVIGRYLPTIVDAAALRLGVAPR